MRAELHQLVRDRSSLGSEWHGSIRHVGSNSRKWTAHGNRIRERRGVEPDLSRQPDVRIDHDPACSGQRHDRLLWDELAACLVVAKPIEWRRTCLRNRRGRSRYCEAARLVHRPRSLAGSKRPHQPIADSTLSRLPSMTQACRRSPRPGVGFRGAPSWIQAADDARPDQSCDHRLLGLLRHSG